MMLTDKARAMTSRIATICIANLLLAAYLAYLTGQLWQLRRGLRRWQRDVEILQQASELHFPTALLLLKQTELGSLAWQRQGRSLQRQLQQMRQLLGLLAFCASFWQQTRHPRQR
jgi:hypothetical protein